jgi:diguanylate cyclase (GGDEF)-like protein
LPNHPTPAGRWTERGELALGIAGFLAAGAAFTLGFPPAGGLLILLSGGWLLTLGRRRETRRLRAERSEEQRKAEALLAVLEAFTSGRIDEARLRLRSEAARELDARTVERIERRLGEMQGAQDPLPGGRSSEAGGFADGRYLFVSFEEEIDRAKRRNLPLTILVMDLENLQETSPTLGHSLGDRSFRRIVHAIRKQMRKCDVCVRSSVDEFILILPGVSRGEAPGVEARLRAAIEETSRPDPTGKSFRIRLRLGSSTFPDDGQSFDRLMALADARTREVRSEGGNRPSGNAEPAPFLPHHDTLTRN